MKTLSLASLAIFLSSFVCGCENPADKAAKATVDEAKTVAEPASDAQKGESLTLTPENTSIEFVGSKVTGSHDGRFDEFEGTFQLVADQVEQSRLNAEIQMDSTWSDNDKLTDHLKSEDFFHVEKFPTSKFETTKIEAIAEGDEKQKEATHTVTGNLTLHGETKSISFPATIEVTSEAAKLNSEFAINRKDFGIDYSGQADNLIRDEVLIKLSIEAPRGKSQAQPAGEAASSEA